jgi:DNA-binding SARP family transcriptional activator
MMYRTLLALLLPLLPLRGEAPDVEPVAGLSLNNGHFFRFNNDIRLSFDLALEQGRAHYLTYILRLTNLGKQNLDLILNANDNATEILLVAGEKLSRKTLRATTLDASPLPFSFHFDLKQDQLTLVVGDTILVENRLGLHPRADYKITIGAAGSPLRLTNLRADPDIVFSRAFSKNENATLYWVIGILLVDIGAFLLYIRQKRKRKREEEETTGIVYRPGARAAAHDAPHPGDVSLFGGFRVIDSAGKDVSKRFTPLLKELFLILLIHSRRDAGGIPVSTLHELLWLDKGVQSASNNRAVNIGKLKTILDAVGAYEIISNSSYIRLELRQGIACDYLSFTRLLREPSLDALQVRQLARLASRGPLLPECNYAWLDPFKADATSALVDTLIGFASMIDRGEERLVIELSDTVLLFDPLNEEALQLKCKALVQTGKHSLASATYTRFAKEYEQLYGIPYQKHFHDVSRNP